MITAKIVVLIITMFTYDGDGGITDIDRHEEVMDSMTSCILARKGVMDTYYLLPKAERMQKGIMTVCRLTQGKDHGQANRGTISL